MRLGGTKYAGNDRIAEHSKALEVAPFTLPQFVLRGLEEVPQSALGVVHLRLEVVALTDAIGQRSA